MVAVSFSDPKTNGRQAFRASPIFDTYTALHLLGNNILLPFLVITFLVAKRVHRHGVLINLCFHWILSGIFNLLPFYAGQHKLENGITFELCVTQAAFLVGTPVMWASGVFMFMLYMISSLQSNRSNLWTNKWYLFMLLGTPYIFEIGFAVSTLIIIFLDDNPIVTPKLFYCTYGNKVLYISMMGATLAFCAGIVVLKVIFCFSLYRNWKTYRRAGRRVLVDRHLIFRAVFFTVFLSVAIAIFIIDLFLKDSIAIHLYTASLGTIVFLIFGTHPDILRTWFFWRKDSPFYVDESRLSRISSSWQSTNLRRQSMAPSMVTTPRLGKKLPENLDKIPMKPQPSRTRDRRPNLMAISIPSPTMKSTELARLVLINEDYQY